MVLTFRVFGEAQPQGSSKAFVPKGWTRPIVTSDNPKNKGWRQLVAEGANRALADLPAYDREVIQGPVRVTIAFYLPRPKALMRPNRPVAHLKAPDVDKLCRSCLDALTHVVWRDDSQVVELTAFKGYADVDDLPHVDIRVEETGGMMRTDLRQSSFFELDDEDRRPLEGVGDNQGRDDDDPREGTHAERAERHDERTWSLYSKRPSTA